MKIEDHKIGNTYKMDNKPDEWKIAYWFITENPKTKEQYDEPRVLIEKDIFDKFNNKIGIDFREVPLRYLTPNQK